MTVKPGVIDEIERLLLASYPDGRTIAEMAAIVAERTQRAEPKVRSTVRTQVSRLRHTRGLSITRHPGPDGITRFTAIR